MQKYFSAKDEAEEYKALHKLYQREAVYLSCRDCWVLVFPLPAKAEPEVTHS